MDLINKTFNYKVTTISPVHIGQGGGNVYNYGLDYIKINQRKNKYLLYDNRDLISKMTPLEIDNYVKKIINSNSTELDTYFDRDLREIIDELPGTEFVIAGKKPNTINKHIKTGLGNFIIPGSSFKGAASGILLKYLIGNNSFSASSKSALFGDISNNLMRFFRSSDIEFVDPEDDFCYNIYPVKIFAAGYDKNNSGIGNWKNKSKGGHMSEFDSISFVNAYECIDRKMNSILKVSIANNYKENFLLNYRKEIPNYNLIANLTADGLLDIIRSHSRAYLDREIKFFETFTNDECTDIIMEELEKLRMINNSNNAALIRLGMGSGFHSITARLTNLSADHTKKVNIYDQFPAKKTRKFAFKINENDELFLMPLGWIKLSL